MSDEEKIELELREAICLVETYVDMTPKGIEHPLEYIMSIRNAVNYIRDAVLDILMYSGEVDLVEVEDPLNSWVSIDKIICHIITGKLKLCGKPVRRLPP